MHAVKCSPRSYREDDSEFETFEDFDEFDVNEADDPLRCLVPVKQELLSTGGSEPLLDVKPNVALLASNLASGRNATDELTSSSEEQQASQKFNELGLQGVPKESLQSIVPAETEDECNVDVDGSDEDSRKASKDLCRECGAVLSSTLNRLRHRCQKFKCATCGWKAPSESALQNHLEEHDRSKPHVCHECCSTFTTHRALRVHLRMHDKGTSTCACRACGANFNSVYNLTRHLTRCRARPADTKGFLCRLCLAGFWSQSLVRRHIRTVHTLEQPFKCSVCVSSFSSRRGLDNHISKVHSVPRPFTCSVCFARYSQREDLMEHLQVHLISSSRRSMGVDKITALAIKKEVGDVDKERRITRSITRSSSMGSSGMGSSGGSSSGSSTASPTGSPTASALENIKAYAYSSDSE